MAAYGVSVLIVKDGLILSVPRRNNPNDFGLPGGKVEEGESEVDAAARELFEETGLVAF
jgi:8-oxo-dGTP pyrophosphatase MutT (NUDIX family)